MARDQRVALVAAVDMDGYRIVSKIHLNSVRDVDTITRMPFISRFSNHPKFFFSFAKLVCNPQCRSSEKYRRREIIFEKGSSIGSVQLV